MKTEYDAIVVGAGPAGCAAAYDLVAAGKRVALLEKSEFPRLKPCAGALTNKTLRALRFDVSPVVRRRCEEMMLSFRGKSKTLSDGKPIVAMTVRSELDDFVVKACIDHGVEFRIGHRLVNLSRAADCWIAETNRGSFRSRFLIGADGANSQVRKLLCRGHHVRFGVALETCIPESCAGDWKLEFDFSAIDHGYGWIIPKDDHLNVGLYTLNSTAPHANERLRAFAIRKIGREFEGPIHGHKIPHGARSIRYGWKTACLVGDAAGMIDPFLGEGIYNAIRSGQLAARAIIEAGNSPLAEFDMALKEIREDLASYHAETRRFYANIDRGYRRLAHWPLGKALVKGFSKGMTVSKIKRKFFSLALA
jgi:geranylgeranyl reductase family protein